MSRRKKKNPFRSSVFAALKITTPTENQIKLVDSLVGLGSVENIVKMVRLFPDERGLSDSRVREVLTRWYPTENQRTRNLPESCRTRYFYQEWLAVEVREMTSGKNTKKTKTPAPPKPRFVTMTKGFNPERPYRPTVVEGRQSEHRQQVIQESMATPAVASQTTVFTAHFIQLMKERVPAAQQPDFRKYVLKNRKRKLSAEQYVKEWGNLNASNKNTTSRPSLAEEKSELHIPQKAPAISTPKPAVVKLTATGSERTVYQRDVAAQASFRRRLFTLWGGKCAIEGIALAGVLEAAHITHGEDFSDDNGILMTPTMHALFDRHLIGIEPDTLTVHVSPLLPDLSQYDGTQLTAPVPLNVEGLTIRWKEYLSHLDYLSIGSHPVG